MTEHTNFTGLFITVSPRTVVFERGEKRHSIRFEGPNMPAEDLEDILSGVNNVPEMAGLLDVDPDKMQEVWDDLVPFA